MRLKKLLPSFALLLVAVGINSVPATCLADPDLNDFTPIDTWIITDNTEDDGTRVIRKEDLATGDVQFSILMETDGTITIMAYSGKNEIHVLVDSNGNIIGDPIYEVYSDEADEG